MTDSEYLNNPQNKGSLKDAIPFVSWSWHFTDRTQIYNRPMSEITNNERKSIYEDAKKVIKDDWMFDEPIIVDGGD